MKRAFVTGGSGFVGGRVIRQLRARGVDVAALARSTPSASVVEALGATAVRGDLDPGDRSIPRWLARATAALTGWMKQPPITRTAITLIDHEVTVFDAKARRDLGYTSHVSREQGLAEMRGT